MNFDTHARRRAAVALLTAVVLLVAACGDSESVGSEDLLEGTDGEAGLRLGETTTTTSAPDDATAQTTAPPTTAAPTTTAAPPTTAPPQQEPAVVVVIYSDSQAGGQLQPRVAQVFAGSLVRFTNQDTVPRSIEADNGAFASGPIAPGASWDYVAEQAGTFNYSDGTRPYAVGTLEVYAS